MHGGRGMAIAGSRRIAVVQRAPQKPGGARGLGDGRRMARGGRNAKEYQVVIVMKGAEGIAGTSLITQSRASDAFVQGHGEVFG
ncbi:hypothetical protein GCM10022254_42470 [Actinomadura meridiana]|uniref:Uncharacterized protein n=1 Tax=Actinomadura meridiana TaxID=559626 RepID=A0ABP8C8Q4_9ACTN